MAGRDILKAAKLPVAVTLVKGWSLKAHGVDAHPDAAASFGHAFTPPQEQGADAAAAIALGDPKMLDEEPTPITQPVKAGLNMAGGIAADEPEWEGIIRAHARRIERIHGRPELQNGFSRGVVLFSDGQVVDSIGTFHLLLA
jgi:hypothetical protein